MVNESNSVRANFSSLELLSLQRIVVLAVTLEQIWFIWLLKVNFGSDATPRYFLRHSLYQFPSFVKISCCFYNEYVASR